MDASHMSISLHKYEDILTTFDLTDATIKYIQFWSQSRWSEIVGFNFGDELNLVCSNCHTSRGYLNEPAQTGEWMNLWAYIDYGCYGAWYFTKEKLGREFNFETD